MGKSKKIKLLYYGDFDGNTGYSMVSKNLISHWSKFLRNNIEITVFATNNFKKTDYSFAENVYVIPALKTRSQNDNDPYCRNSFLKLLYNGNYTHLFCNNDIEVLNDLYSHLKNIKEDKRKENRPKFKSMIYFPIDAKMTKDKYEVLKFFEKPVTYTEFGKKILKETLYPNVFKKVSVIPHGTNTNDFFPIESKEILKELRTKYFGENKNKFIFGTVNRNSARKDISSLIIAFSEFIKKYPETYLYIHSNPLDECGVNFYKLIDTLNLKENVHIQFADNNITESKDKQEATGCISYSLNMLNELYNCFDCYITTTTAEGWGLTLTEAMATKTKAICPIHTSFTEITNDGELVIPLRRLHESCFVDDNYKLRYKSDKGEIIEAMKIALSSDKKNLATLSYNKVVKYNWNKISQQFLTLLKGL
tara:strand:- start:5749 stop:7011 length:1263 start_codon:yes stop_codon:yes gene_type:complete